MIERPYRIRIFIEEPGLFRAEAFFWGGSHWTGWGYTPAAAEADLGPTEICVWLPFLGSED